MSLKIVIKGGDEGSQGPTLGSLPSIVARDEGLFAEEGLEVEYAVQPEHWRIHPPRVENDIEQVDSFNRHYFFEEGHSQVFNACEWGQVRRAYDSKRGGKVIGRNDGAQWHAIVAAPDSPFTHPRTLFNQPVAVRFHAGSHYATLEMLDGFVRRDEIQLVNLSQLDGYHAVLRGEIAAVTLPEPWITLALNQGFRVLVETREYSAEIGDPTVDPAAYAAYNRARRKAAQRINADKLTYLRRYFSDLVSSLPTEFRNQLRPEDLHVSRLHWLGPQPYPPAEFQRTYDWMVSWGLIGADADYDQLVNRDLALVGA